MKNPDSTIQQKIAEKVHLINFQGLRLFQELREKNLISDQEFQKAKELLHKGINETTHNQEKTEYFIAYPNLEFLKYNKSPDAQQIYLKSAQYRKELKLFRFIEKYLIPIVYAKKD